MTRSRPFCGGGGRYSDAMRPSATLAALVAAAALALAGCGDSETTGSAIGAAADIVPADVAAFVVIDVDRDSEQVQRLLELGESLPGARSAFTEMLREATGGGSWDEDVDPALGEEVSFVVVGGQQETVALTQADDEAKLRQLVQRESEELEVRTIDGWHAVGTAAALDAFTAARGGDSLADDDDYKKIFEDLEEEALLRAYGSGAALSQALAQVPGAPRDAASGFEAAGVAVESLEDGLRLDGVARGVTQEAGTYEPTLLDRVPGDAFLAASFGPADSTIAELRKQGGEFVPQLERGLGVTLDELAAVLGGESILYARGGIGVPEVTLAAKPDDPAAAVATLRKLAEAATGVTGGRLRTTQLDGLDVHVLQVEIVQVQFAAVDDAVVVTTGAAGLRDFRRDGDKLGDSDRFDGALETAGWDGGETAGFLYVDFQAALPVVEGLGGLAGGIPDDARAALERLDTLAATSQADGDVVRFGATLRTR